MGSRKILIWLVVINVKYIWRQTEEVCDRSAVEKHKRRQKLKTSVWHKLVEEYKHKQTEDVCGRALTEEYKSKKTEDVCGRALTEEYKSKQLEDICVAELF
jgi:hypothetical protein